MKSASPLSREEKVALCRDLYRTGVSTRDIQARTGIGKTSVALYLAEAGVKMDSAAQISAKMAGRPGRRCGARHTEEARAKISAARSGKPTTAGQSRTPEQRARMTEAQRRSWKGRKKIKGQISLFGKLPPKPQKLAAPKSSANGMPKVKKLARIPRPQLTRDEIIARRLSRDACKRMLRRVLTMARVRKDLPTERMLGYSKLELRAHLEGQFRPGMSWSSRDSFHIDHIIPIAHYFKLGIFDPAVINALSNLQVLTPAENRVKRDKLITDAGVQAGIVDLA